MPKLLRCSQQRSAPLRAGVHVALFELWSGFGVFRVAVTVVLGQRLVGPDVCALGRVQLVAWGREATTLLLLLHSKSESKSIFNHDDGQLTSSARDRAGEEVSLSPLVSNWFVEQKLDNGVLGASVLYLHSTSEEGGHSGQKDKVKLCMVYQTKSAQ